MSTPDVSSIASSIFKQAASSLTAKLSPASGSSTQASPNWASVASSHDIAAAQLNRPSGGSHVHHSHHRNDADPNAAQAATAGTPSSSATNRGSVADALDITS
jgi:hypothetical protein